MNIFDVVNELSVLCVTLLMMAVSTIWYSSWMFGNIWMRETSSTEQSLLTSPFEMFRKTALTFVSYFTITLSVAYILAVAPQLHLPLHTVTLTIFAFTVAVLAPISIWEQKSLRYFLISIGFMVVFIVASVYILTSWPW